MDKFKQNISKVYLKYGNLMIFAALVIIFSILSPVFLSVSNWLNLLRQISMMAIISVGGSMLIISGGLDLSVGSQVGLMNILAGIMFERGVNPALALLIAIGVTTAFGAFNGVVIVKTGVAPMMATIAMLTALRGLTYILCGGYMISNIPPSVKSIGQGLINGLIPVPVILMIVVIAFGAVFMSKTYMGRYFYAIGNNYEATRLCGIDVAKVRILAYTLSGTMCGIAGSIMLGRIASAQPSSGVGYELDMLTAVVLGGVSINGGRGSVVSAMLGVLVIGTLANGMSLIGVNDYWQQLIKGAVLLIVISIDSLRIQKALGSVS